MTEATKNDEGRKSITVRLLPELYNEIERQANDDERTISQFVERHLRKHFGSKQQGVTQNPGGTLAQHGT